MEAWEAGFETNLLRNRLHFEGVYYKKNTKDLLAEVPGISGTIPGIGNLGQIQNKGVEMAVTWRDQIGEWGYSVSANLTTIKNEVKSLVQEGYSIIAGDKQQSYTMAGYPIGYFYGYKVEGVYQSQADIDASPKNTLATVTPGDLKFADVDGNGEITPEDRTMIGNPTPKVTYGFSLGVNYKNWSLGIDMMGQGGNKIFRTWDNYNFAQFNYLEQRLDRWHGEGTSNTQPLLNSKHSINYLNSDYYIESGNFFRIRNVQLAYAFDKSLLAKIRLQQGGEAAEPAKAVLVYVMSNTLKLLHPFMPFITEELYQALPGSAETIMTQSWPTFDEAHNWAEEEEAFEKVMDYIKAVRTMRTEMNVHPAKKTSMIIETADPAPFRNAEVYLAKFAFATDVTFTEKYEGSTDGMVQVSTHAARGFIPMMELIDREKELARLNKEKAKAEKELAMFENQLANPKFVERAPAALVEEIRAKRTNSQSKLANIEQSIKALG